MDGKFIRPPIPMNKKTADDESWDKESWENEKSVDCKPVIFKPPETWKQPPPPLPILNDDDDEWEKESQFTQINDKVVPPPARSKVAVGANNDDWDEDAWENESRLSLASPAFSHISSVKVKERKTHVQDKKFIGNALGFYEPKKLERSATKTKNNESNDDGWEEDSSPSVDKKREENGIYIKFTKSGQCYPILKNDESLEPLKQELGGRSISPRDWSAADVKEFLIANGFRVQAIDLARAKVNGDTMMGLTNKSLSEIKGFQCQRAMIVSKIFYKLRQLCRPVSNFPNDNFSPRGGRGGERGRGPGRNDGQIGSNFDSIIGSSGLDSPLFPSSPTKIYGQRGRGGRGFDPDFGRGAPSSGEFKGRGRGGRGNNFSRGMTPGRGLGRGNFKSREPSNLGSGGNVSTTDEDWESEPPAAKKSTGEDNWEASSNLNNDYNPGHNSNINKSPIPKTLTANDDDDEWN